MRLIDGDALVKELQELYKSNNWSKHDIHFSLADMESNIGFMPAVIDGDCNTMKTEYSVIFKGGVIAKLFLEKECPIKIYNTETEFYCSSLSSRPYDEVMDTLCDPHMVYIVSRKHWEEIIHD